MPKGVSKEANNWTVIEMNIVRNNPQLSAGALSVLLPGRTPKAVRGFRSKHNLMCDRSVVSGLWSDNDLQFLKENAGNMTMDQLMVKFPNRTCQAIHDAYNNAGVDRSKFMHKYEANNISIPNNSEDLAYFMGVLASDGWTEPGVARLDVRDEEFAKYWGELGEQLFGIKYIFYKSRKKELYHSLLYRCALPSKKLCKWLGNFKKEFWSVNPKVGFVRDNKIFAAAFLSGYIDSDGHVGEGVFIACSVKKSSKFLSELLLKFGDEFNISDSGISINKALRDTLRSYIKLHVKRKADLW